VIGSSGFRPISFVTAAAELTIFAHRILAAPRASRECQCQHRSSQQQTSHSFEGLCGFPQSCVEQKKRIDAPNQGCFQVLTSPAKPRFARQTFCTIAPNFDFGR
jgi:hypothetical protein